MTIKAVCQNCDFAGDREKIKRQFPDIPNLAERVSPGELVPFGECPECGALVHLMPGSVDEMRDDLLKHISTLVKYWATVKDPAGAEKGGETLARLDGLAFSILTTLDGSSGPVTGYVVRPRVEVDDEEIIDGPDVAGTLHEHYSMFFTALK